MERLTGNEKETLYNDLRSKIIIVTEEESMSFS